MLQSLQSRASLPPNTLDAMKFKCRFVFKITQGQAESRAAEVPEHRLDHPRLTSAGTSGPTWPGTSRGTQSRVLGTTSRWLLEISRKGDYTSPRGSCARALPPAQQRGALSARGATPCRGASERTGQESRASARSDYVLNVSHG